MDKRIIIEGGKVHGVGFRPLLLGKARRLGLARYEAENAWEKGKEVVDVSFGGDEKAVREFAEFCKRNHPAEAQVSTVREAEPPERILPIDEYDRILASEQQNTMVRTGLAMVGLQKHMMGTQDKMMSTQDKMMGTQEEMKNTQDKMMGTQYEMKNTQDKMMSTQDEMKGTQDKILSMQEKTVEKLGEFHMDTVHRFDVVDDKYGRIADNLGRIIEEMREDRLEARKSTERIIEMISSMKFPTSLREHGTEYTSRRKGKGTKKE